MSTRLQLIRRVHREVRDPATPRRPRWRFFGLTVSAFIFTGTITFISVPPALSPTFVLSSDAQANVAPTNLIDNSDTASLTMLTSSDTGELGSARRLTFGAGVEDALQTLAFQGASELAATLGAVTGFESRRERPHYEVRLARVTGIIERSLFDDGQDAGLSDRLIMELAEIFGWDIDFVLDLRRGDTFTVVHEEKYWRGQKVADGDILAAEFVNQGRVFRAIGYRARTKIEYYTPDGLALRRAFLRTPVKFSRVSSLFSSSRYHPLLKMWRAHNGVDYDAPIGTPVRATASGRVMAVGWNGGYGNTVTIRHPGPYSTLYAHLKRCRPGLRAGQHVAQGEIIGYVGRTGLATGPHLHYELQVNGAHRDPLTFELPTSDRITVAPNMRPLFLRHAAELITQFEISTDAHLEHGRYSGPFKMAVN